jgi:hypothetical protein
MGRAGVLELRKEGGWVGTLGQLNETQFLVFSFNPKVLPFCF